MIGQNTTSSEVASVLEASANAASGSGSTATAKLVLAPPAAATQAAASFWRRAPLVGLLLGRQRRLALLFVLFQQLAGLLLLQLGVDDAAEALALLRQREEACHGGTSRGGQKGTRANPPASLWRAVEQRLPTFHFEDCMLGDFLAIAFHLLLDPLLVVVVGGADHHRLALEACKQAHLPLLAGGRQVGLRREDVGSLN